MTYRRRLRAGRKSKKTIRTSSDTDHTNNAINMPNVLILGGSGYLGLAVGQALVRSGNYSVWGTTRSADKAKTLETNEVTPVVGEATNPEWLANTIAANHIDTVIDATQAYEQAGAILGGIITAAQKRADALAAEKSVGPKLGFIYTSGSWVHGSPSRRVSDLTVPGTSASPDKPATAVGWRPAHEQAILAARNVLDVAVLRPCAIYGRGSWVWGVWWSPLLAAAKANNTSDPVQVPADATARTGTVHVDDLADAFVRAADRLDGQLGSWPVFDIGAETLPIGEIMEAAAKVLGVKASLVYGGTHDNPFLEALSLVSNSDTARARTVLGWEPKHRDFIQKIAVTVSAWRSVQE
jgi:nucleoside-diphosphate-sugar epimerase